MLAELEAAECRRFRLEPRELLRQIRSERRLQNGRSWIRTTDLRLIRAAL
jgi:hypothetical protein